MATKPLTLADIHQALAACRGARGARTVLVSDGPIALSWHHARRTYEITRDGKRTYAGADIDEVIETYNADTRPTPATRA